MGLNHRLEIVRIIHFFTGKIASAGEEGHELNRIVIQVTIENIVRRKDRTIHPSAFRRSADRNIGEQIRRVADSPVGVLCGRFIITAVNHVDNALITVLC